MADVASKTLAACKDVKIDLVKGVAERVMVWKAGKTWCRARPDWMSNDRKVVLNYKSTAGSAESNAWTRNQMVPMGFDVEAAHYLSGNAALGSPGAMYLFLVQENYPPYACSFVSPDPAMMELAEMKLEYAMRLWAYALQSATWPGYPQRISYAMPTAWQIAEADEWKDKLGSGAQG